LQLVALSDVKSELGITTSDYDSLLNLLIDGVSGLIEDYLNRKLTYAQYTEYFDGGRKLYYLTAYPVDTGQSFTVTVNDYTKTSGTDYYLWDEEGLLEFISEPSDSKPRTVKVVYTGGYTESGGVLSVPDSIKRVCMWEVIKSYRNKDKIGLRSVSYPDGSVTTIDTYVLSGEARALLRKHRKIPTLR
jgi:hypothetical protein